MGRGESHVSALTPLGTARGRFLEFARPQDGEGEPAGPPWLAPEEDLEPASLGWEIARCAPGLPFDAAAGLAALAATCIAAMRAGSTRVPLAESSLIPMLAYAGIPATVPAVLAVVDRARAGLAGDPIAALVGRPGQRKPLVIDGGWLYAERMHVLEERFSARVRERLERPSPARDARRMQRALVAVAAGPPPLTDEQKRAVQKALTAPLALVTGAPGTGKTSIVVALVRALAWLGERMDAVAIAAPTGKAAQRLQEALRAGLASAPRDIAEIGLPQMVPVPQTLHRLLGLSPQTGRFAHHENDPLAQRVVIVDEASMIDLAMMDRLLRALRADSRLVLLGDADQLPSVEAGAVFRDLCASIGAARLTVNLRVARVPSARRIVEAAAAVNAGRLDPGPESPVAIRRTVDEIQFEGVEHLAAPWHAVAEAVLDRWWQTRLASLSGFVERATRSYRAPFTPSDEEDLRALFELYSRCRVLCATRSSGFPASAQAINDRMLVRLTQSRAALSGASRWRRAGLSAGAPLVVERNDYERQLYNGDSGVVVRAESGDTDGTTLLAVFRRGGGQAFEAYPLESLSDTSPGFAMTVHKAQGSEFDDVLVVLPEEDLPLLTRELLYTAITRARRSVVLVGDADLLARSVSRSVERYSGISEKIRSSAL
jgi:exodeoxyribonuclease V alpha subunit